MNVRIVFCLGLLAAASARAQVFRSEAVNGAVLGGVAGAVIGNNSGSLNHNAWKGAAIGAGAGLLLGQAVGNANDHARGSYGDPRASGAYIYRQPASVYIGYNHNRWHGYGRDAWYDGYSSYAPSYSVRYYAPASRFNYSSAATNGLWWGALAGGIIGHNSGEFRHNGWRGAAWGAGVGWLLGSIADANRPTVVYEQPAVVAPAPVAPAPQPVTVINNYYGNTSSPMSSANALFGR